MLLLLPARAPPPSKLPRWQQQVQQRHTQMCSAQERALKKLDRDGEVRLRGFRPPPGLASACIAARARAHAHSLHAAGGRTYFGAAAGPRPERKVAADAMWSAAGGWGWGCSTPIWCGGRRRRSRPRPSWCCCPNAAAHMLLPKCYCRAFSDVCWSCELLRSAAVCCSRCVPTLTTLSPSMLQYTPSPPASSHVHALLPTFWCPHCSQSFNDVVVCRRCRLGGRRCRS